MNEDGAVLNPDVLRHRILSEQVALMCRLTTSPLFGSIFIGAIVAYLVSKDAGLPASIAWYAASIVIMLVRWRVAHAFVQRQRDYTEVLRWRSGMLMLIVLFGAIWSIP